MSGLGVRRDTAVARRIVDRRVLHLIKMSAMLEIACKSVYMLH